MKRVLIALVTVACAHFTHAEPNEDVWSTAVAERASDGHRIVFRYLNESRKPIDRSAFPDVLVLSWKYVSEDGMPTRDELNAMYELEDLLTRELESAGRGMLVLISTGENVRLATYYARSAADFRAGLQAILVPANRFPVEISSKHDPDWAEYERFKRGVRTK